MSQRYDICLVNLVVSCPVYTGKFRTVKAAYCATEEQLDTYLAYLHSAHTNGLNYDELDIVKNTNFRGPDWYFLEGYPGDRDGPSDWRIETLSEKKEKFDAFVNELSEIQRSGGALRWE